MRMMSDADDMGFMNLDCALQCSLQGRETVENGVFSHTVNPLGFGRQTGIDQVTLFSFTGRE